VSARRRTAAQQQALASAERLVGEGPHPEPPPAEDEPGKFQTLWNFGSETTGFNYATLPEDDAAEARATADRIRRLQHNERYLVGELLVALRPKFQHGQWLAWLALEVRISDQSASNYMAYYHLTIRAPSELSQLMSADVAYRVARLPEPLQDKILALAQEKHAAGGRRITAREVNKVIRADDGGASGKDDANDPEIAALAKKIYSALAPEVQRELLRTLETPGAGAKLLRCLRALP